MRSKLEENFGKLCTSYGVPFEYEATKLPYTIPESVHKYTPDFILENGIIIETKGVLSLDDRKKMCLVKAQYPELDIRFVFGNAKNRIAPRSKTTYGDWCDQHHFKWCDIRDKTKLLKWFKEDAYEHKR